MRRLRWPRFSLLDLALVTVPIAALAAMLGTNDELSREDKLLSGGLGIPILVWMLYAWKFVHLNFGRRDPPQSSSVGPVSSLRSE
jgi:hypothetical protein